MCLFVIIGVLVGTTIGTLVPGLANGVGPSNTLGGFIGFFLGGAAAIAILNLRNRLSDRDERKRAAAYARLKSSMKAAPRVRLEQIQPRGPAHSAGLTDGEAYAAAFKRDGMRQQESLLRDTQARAADGRAAEEAGRYARRAISSALRAAEIPASRFPRRMGLVGSRTPAEGWQVAGSFQGHYVVWLTVGGQWVRASWAGDLVEELDPAGVAIELAGVGAHWFQQPDGSHAFSWQPGGGGEPSTITLHDKILETLSRAQAFARTAR